MLNGLEIFMLATKPEATTTFPITWVREQFPALQAEPRTVFFDNGAGAQVPQRVLDAVHDHLLRRNVQRGGRYRQSREVDAVLTKARETVATFLNAKEPEEIAFGMNATSFMRLISLAIGYGLGQRREIVITDLDHEANIATWLALEHEGASIRWWKVRKDGALYVEDLEQLLTPNTRLVACTMASNAIGSVLDIRAIAQRTHSVGAELFVDAVHFGPHGLIDVQALECDYLVCSGYKIFGPHMGFLWGKRAALDALPTFREDFIPDTAPAKYEIGTYVYENVAGMQAAISYLEELGERVRNGTGVVGGRYALTAAMHAIREYEMRLSGALLAGMAKIDDVTVYGRNKPSDAESRVPTVCFNVGNVGPQAVTETLASCGIAVRDGHMYSPRLMRRLGLSDTSGAVRASLVHYNTIEEIDSLLHELQNIVTAR